MKSARAQRGTRATTLPAFIILSGRERLARQWSLLWKAGVLPSLALGVLVTAQYWLALIKALRDFLR